MRFSLRFLLVALALSAVPGSAARGENPVAGAALYRERCALCHGAHGEANALGRAKPLVSLDPAAIAAKLESFQTGQPAASMKAKMKSGLSAAEIAALTGYIASLPR